MFGSPFDAAAALGLIVAGYLLGSLSCAILVARACGYADPREHGSGNPGASNIARLHGRLAGGLTLAGDLLKALLPMLAARALGFGPEVVAAVGGAAFVGHLYPVWHRFRGGKGVATLFGYLCGAHPLAALWAGGVWLACAGVFRFSSVSGIATGALAPVFLFAATGWSAATILAAPMAALLVWRHRDNLRRLRAGEESRIDGA